MEKRLNAVPFRLASIRCVGVDRAGRRPFRGFALRVPGPLRMRIGGFEHLCSAEISSNRQSAVV
jgi:hypothetical protein